MLVIRNPYVILGLCVIGILILIAVVKMPENKDHSTSESIGISIRRLFQKAKFREGVIAQMFYVGAQIMCWTYIYQYAETLGIDNRAAVPYAMTALVIFLIGRWVCTFLLRYINSGRLLMYLALCAMLFTVGAIFITGIPGLYSLIMISFCMSLMFPTIYGIALEGLGEDAKFGAAFLVMAIVGGAIMPVAQGMILDIGGSGYTDVRFLGVPEVNFSFILPFLCFIIVAIYGYRVYKVFPNSSIK